MKTYFRTNRIIINSKIVNKKYRVTIEIEKEINDEIEDFINKFSKNEKNENLKEKNHCLYHVSIKINENNNHFEEEMVCYFVLSKAYEDQILLKYKDEFLNSNDLKLDKSLYIKEIVMDPLYSGNLFYFICILKGIKISQQDNYKSLYILTKLDLVSIWLNLERVGFKRVYSENNSISNFISTNTLNNFKSTNTNVLYKYDINEENNSDWDSLINSALTNEQDSFWKQHFNIHIIKSKL